MVWDYHVVLVLRPRALGSRAPSGGETAGARPDAWVYDLDSRCPVPCRANGGPFSCCCFSRRTRSDCCPPYCHQTRSRPVRGAVPAEYVRRTFPYAAEDGWSIPASFVRRVASATSVCVPRLSAARGAAASGSCPCRCTSTTSCRTARTWCVPYSRASYAAPLTARAGGPARRGAARRVPRGAARVPPAARAQDGAQLGAHEPHGRVRRDGRHQRVRAARQRGRASGPGGRRRGGSDVRRGPGNVGLFTLGGGEWLDGCS